MNALMQLTEQDYEKMADDIIKISMEKSEDDLLLFIGNALHDSGYRVSTSENDDIIEPEMFNHHLEKVNLIKSLNFLMDKQSLTATRAKEDGGKFWRRFKEKLRIAICKDGKIKDIITGNGTLKDYLVIGIPLVLTALGVVTLDPIFLAIIAATFALILKVGFEAYCDNLA